VVCYRHFRGLKLQHEDFVTPIYEYVKGEGWVVKPGKYFVIFYTPRDGWQNIIRKGASSNYQEAQFQYNEQVRLCETEIRESGWKFEIVPDSDARGLL
jgi:hypothetical protein